MNKKEIFKELRKIYKSVKEPRDIDFNLENEILCVSMNEAGVLANMQSNESAFEGWILALMSNLNKNSERIIRVSLVWTTPKGKTIPYNRFVYRVVKFSEKFDWFEVEDSKQNEIEDFKNDYDAKNLFLNYPNSAAKDIPSKEGEALIERKFKDNPEILKGVKLDHQNHQLPVGVFNDAVGGQNYFLTGNRSAIDLWGIKSDELFFFELKYRNISVGIVSEILLYCWILEDLIMNRKINYPTVSEKVLLKDDRNFSIIYKKVGEESINKIIGVFLADKLHPLVNDILISLINRYLAEKKIEIMKQEYLYSKEIGIVLL